MPKNVLRIDPGFVHHRKIEALLGGEATAFINQQVSQIPLALPEGIRQVQVDHIYTKVLVGFCKKIAAPSLPQVLMQRKGNLFCSIVRTAPCPNLYDEERVRVDCETTEGGPARVVLEFTVRRISGDTLRGYLYQGDEIAVIGEVFGLRDESLILHPLIMGLPIMCDELTGDPAWELYGDFYQVFVENFNEFAAVKDVEIPKSLEDMRLISEGVFKEFLGQILNESTPSDWGGESSDFVTSHLHLHGNRIEVAFLLKGPARFCPMDVSHLGKRGDQIVRLATEPARVLVVQHCHEITSAVKTTLKRFAANPADPKYYCFIDGRESLRMLDAFGMRQWALDESRRRRDGD